MECGDLRTLSALNYGRCASVNSTPRCFRYCKIQTPPTPRARSSGTIGTGGLDLKPRVSGNPVPSPWTSPGELLPRSHLHSPRMKPVSRLSMAARDKESLLDEIIQLKRALIQKGQMLRMNNARSCATESRNRRLEMDVFDLETTLNVDGPRTGSPHRLRAKLRSVQTTVEQLQDTCDCQREELLRLRRDLRVTRTREVEAERDIFANEVKRLQKIVKGLQALHNRISCENRDLGRLKAKCQKLEIVNQRLESCMTATSIKPQAQPCHGAHRHNMTHVDPSTTPRRDGTRISTRQGGK